MQKWCALWKHHEVPIFVTRIVKIYRDHTGHMVVSLHGQPALLLGIICTCKMTDVHDTLYSYTATLYPWKRVLSELSNDSSPAPLWFTVPKKDAEEDGRFSPLWSSISGYKWHLRHCDEAHYVPIHYFRQVRDFCISCKVMLNMHNNLLTVLNLCLKQFFHFIHSKTHTV